MTEVIGAAIFHSVLAADGTTAVYATHLDPVISISVDFLHEIMVGNVPAVRVADNSLIMDLANGTWTYQLGEYNPESRGIMARLTAGEPLTDDIPKS